VVTYGVATICILGQPPPDLLQIDAAIARPRWQHRSRGGRRVSHSPARSQSPYGVFGSPLAVFNRVVPSATGSGEIPRAVGIDSPHVLTISFPQFYPRK